MYKRQEEICAYIAAHPEHKNVAIALSGDVGFYSGAKKLLETLHRELPMIQKKVYCGISSMIYFCAKLETPWEDVHPVSLHGSCLLYTSRIEMSRKTVVFLTTVFYLQETAFLQSKNAPRELSLIHIYIRSYL